MPYASLDDRNVGSAEQVAEGLAELAGMPAFLRASLARLPASVLRARPGPEPDQFSLHEHAWHLRDIEVLGYARRVRAVASEEHPQLADIDGTRLALEKRYLDLPLEAALDEFERARAASLEFLRGLPHARFSRRGEMEGVGCVTLAQLIEMWRNHDRGHRDEIESMAARAPRAE